MRHTTVQADTQAVGGGLDEQAHGTAVAARSLKMS